MINIEIVGSIYLYMIIELLSFYISVNYIYIYIL